MKTATYIAASFMLAAGTPASAAWLEASSNHFLIYSEQDASTLRQYAEKLERFDHLLRLLQGVSAASAPILPSDRLTIYALPSTSAVQRVTGDAHAAGPYLPRFTGSIILTARQDDPTAYDLQSQMTLLHEYTQYFMMHYYPGSYPGWFISGYGGFMATVAFAKNGDIGVGLPGMPRAARLSKIDTVPLNVMFAMPLPSKNPDRTEDWAMKGWLLVRYLTFEPSRQGQLPAFLAALRKGTPPNEAAQTAFGDLSKLDQELHEYYRRPTLPHFILKADQVPAAPITIRPLTPGENAVMPARIETKIGVVNAGEGRRVAAWVQKLAKPFPNDPAVQCELAEAEHNAQDADATDAAADRILASAPGNFCGLMFKGYAALRRASEAKAPPGDKNWDDSRHWFSLASRASPENPWPMGMYYETFRQAGIQPSADGLAALLGAQARAPEDWSVRMLSTIELLRSGRTTEARRLMPMLINESYGAIADGLMSVYSRIGHDDPTALAAELEGRPPEPKSDQTQKP